MTEERLVLAELLEKRIGYMLAHEQFPVPELIDLGKAATRGGVHPARNQ
jgi:hypothetical protein